jgi:predicted nucleic acid-binding protein
MAIQQGKLKVVDIDDGELPFDIHDLPLDAGEKQALYLAQATIADLVLFDDEKVRDEAKARGLSVKGPLGLIVEAYHAGLLGFNDVENTVEAIIEREDIWISEELCRRVLSKLKDH